MDKYMSSALKSSALFKSEITSFKQIKMNGCGPVCLPVQTAYVGISP